MKKIILIITLLTAISATSYAEDLSVQIASYRLEVYIQADVLISNNTSKYLDYAEIEMSLLLNNRNVGILSKSVYNMPPGAFVSKEFWFKETTAFDSYTYRVLKLAYR
jgi:hypothetical protein